MADTRLVFFNVEKDMVKLDFLQRIIDRPDQMFKKIQSYLWANEGRDGVDPSPATIKSKASCGGGEDEKNNNQPPIFDSKLFAKLFLSSSEKFVDLRGIFFALVIVMVLMTYLIAVTIYWLMEQFSHGLIQILLSGRILSVSNEAANVFIG